MAKVLRLAPRQFLDVNQAIQSATQINEQTLSFLPRLIITLVTLIVLGPWLGGLVTDFTERLIVEIPTLLG